MKSPYRKSPIQAKRCCSAQHLLREPSRQPAWRGHSSKAPNTQCLTRRALIPLSFPKPRNSRKSYAVHMQAWAKGPIGVAGARLPIGTMKPKGAIAGRTPAARGAASRGLTESHEPQKSKPWGVGGSLALAGTGRAACLRLQKHLCRQSCDPLGQRV